MKANRRNWVKKMIVAIATIGIAKTGLFAASKNSKVNQISAPSAGADVADGASMKVGAFSVSLNVKDLAASQQFYEQIGFTVFAGSMKQQYLIMKNGNALIGLFHGMFSKTILTFNPGWDENAQKLDGFDDVRKIQQQLKSKGVKLDTEADEQSKGPASITLTDPDGNSILFDQHV